MKTFKNNLKNLKTSKKSMKTSQNRSKLPEKKKLKTIKTHAKNLKPINELTCLEANSRPCMITVVSGKEEMRNWGIGQGFCSVQLSSLPPSKFKSQFRIRTVHIRSIDVCRYLVQLFSWSCKGSMNIFWCKLFPSTLQTLYFDFFFFFQKFSLNLLFWVFFKGNSYSALRKFSQHILWEHVQ